LARADRPTSRERRDEISRQHREYVERIMAEKQMKATPLAEAAGLAASTLTRVLKEGNTRPLSTDTLSKLYAYSGIQFYLGGEPHGPHGLAEEAVEFDAESGDPAVSDAIKALIGNREAVYRTIISRALECRGYLPGDTVIVDLGRKPAPGDIVWAEVYKLGRSAPETVMRIYAPPFLAVATLDQKLRPIVVDDARVIIKGVVLPHRLRPGTPTSLIG